MAAQSNSQATQQGIIGQQIFVNTQIYSGQKYGEVLNLNNNTNYSISPNAVKLLPVVSNDNNYVKLYTETNASVKVGDMVYIMYDENMSHDPIQQYEPLTGRTILDSYYEFSGCTDWIYLKQIQGYKVLSIDETNNEITIERFYDSSLNNVKLYNHYLSKIYVNNMNFYGGWIDGVSFRTVQLNTNSDSYIDVDIKQCIVLSGTTSYFTDFRDKYDSQYVSINSDLVTNTKKLPPSVNPYKYKPYQDIKSNESLTSSYFTYNNKSYGYTYLYNTNLYNCIINNGYYKNCIISGGTIYGGDFIECRIYDTVIQSGSFINSTINSNSQWYYGIWYGSGITSFGPSVWYNGVWNEGIFSGKTWVTGIFNAGKFTDSIWVNGIFNGGGSIFVSDQNNFVNSFWSGGTFNFGWMSNCIWLKGKFNGGIFEQCNWFGGTFNNGTFFNSFWSGGTFNNGIFKTSYWFDGTFNNGNFTNSIWYNGIFNNGVFKTGYSGDIFTVTETTYKWYKGTFNYGEFNNSIWLDGTFNNGFFKTNSIWSGGTFNFGEFNDSVWLQGDWNNGIVNNSSFHKVNWKNGSFNSGVMGKEMLISSMTLYDLPVIYWSGGTFNNGIFGNSNCITSIGFNNEILSRCTTIPSKIYWYGGDFYGGKFYNNYSNFCINPPGTKSYVVGRESGGFYDGIFHEGWFYGVYHGGHWVNGWFHNKNYNWTNQIIPVSYKYNRYYNSHEQINNQL